jgi:hypothetical protein
MHRGSGGRAGTTGKGSAQSGRGSGGEADAGMAVRCRWRAHQATIILYSIFAECGRASMSDRRSSNFKHT